MSAFPLAPLHSSIARVQEFVTYSSSGAWQRGGSDVTEPAVAVTVLALLVFCVLGVVWIRHRTRLQERRLELLRELATRGQVTPRVIEEHLRPAGRLKSVIMIAAWFLLIGGAAMLGTAFAQGWPSRWHSEFGEPAIMMLVIAVATLSAPLMLREMRRQNAL